MLNRIDVSEHLLPHSKEATLQFLVCLTLELRGLALSLASELVRLALCLAGNLVRFALCFTGGLGDGLLYGFGGLFCKSFMSACIREEDLYVRTV